ncbi:MAG TPA: HypC/HybG/HupF family hydrogenase formation chaperone [Candidatus Binataceae bacterium]|nr:HypC/HybG/HupF family hydrogenase formation chaperone [Candidatus Binataceae bacterium]
MCLGIVGQVVELDGGHPDLAQVDVAGLTRRINIAIIADEALKPGDWILIHSGFAMQKIDEQTARMQMEALQDYTGADSQNNNFDFSAFDDTADEPGEEGQT